MIESKKLFGKFKKGDYMKKHILIYLSVAALLSTATIADASGGSKGAAAAKEAKISVTKATGANAYTVEGAFTNCATLDKKKVVIRGKVVKVSSGIMGKNWFHLQDGTGSATKGTHDLVITSKDMVSMGDLVTATGTLGKDRDFGSGYRYNVIVEDATFKK